MTLQKVLILISYINLRLLEGYNSCLKRSCTLEWNAQVFQTILSSVGKGLEGSVCCFLETKNLRRYQQSKNGLLKWQKY